MQDVSKQALDQQNSGMLKPPGIAALEEQADNLPGVAAFFAALFAGFLAGFFAFFFVVVFFFADFRAAIGRFSLVAGFGAPESSRSSLAGKCFHRAQVFLPLDTKAEDIVATDTNGCRDLENLVVFDGGDGFVCCCDGIKTAQ